MAATPFRRLRGLAVALYVLLSIAGVLALVTIPVVLHLRSVAADHTNGLGAISVNSTVRDANDAVSAVSGFLILISIAIFVVLIIWMWRAASNLALFGRIRPKFAAGFAIGGWFIPVAFAVIPGMQMYDIWKGSGPPLQPGERPKGSQLVVWWWLAFVPGRFLSYLVPSMTVGHLYRSSSFRTSSLLLMIGSGLLVVAAVLGILVVRGITQRQDAGLAALGGGGRPGVPGPAWTPGPTTVTTPPWTPTAPAAPTPVPAPPPEGLTPPSAWPAPPPRSWPAPPEDPGPPEPSAPRV
ncbi:MAG: DUF4328 domain-containing protein [Acidimicrobiia bacterium]